MLFIIIYVFDDSKIHLVNQRVWIKNMKDY